MNCNYKCSYYFIALSILKGVQDPVIVLPQISMARTALSLMKHVKTPVQVVEALIRGLGGHLQTKQHIIVANEVKKK